MPDRKAYQLMNKDRIVADISLEPGLLGSRYVLGEVRGPLPAGFRELNRWLENRKASKHNAHLRRIMTEMGCERTEGFLRLTHAASINDTFWVREKNEAVSWADVSLYRNEFSETVSRLAFEGLGLYNGSFSSTSPELTTNGSFRKCFRRESGEIFIYKRGYVTESTASVSEEKNPDSGRGLEPYCEVLASELATKLCAAAVSYELCTLHGETAARCRLFTSEQEGFAPYSGFVTKEEDRSPEAMLSFFRDLHAEDAFRRMLLLDALTFNDDRHLGNFGVIIDNDTGRPLRMAPVFDLNQALFPDLTLSAFQTFPQALLDYWPKIGNDFTELGQLILTPSIRKDLESLRNFRFTFRGDSRFPAQRVGILERIVQMQIDAILRGRPRKAEDVYRGWAI